MLLLMNVTCQLQLETEENMIILHFNLGLKGSDMPDQLKSV